MSRLILSIPHKSLVASYKLTARKLSFARHQPQHQHQQQILAPRARLTLGMLHSRGLFSPVHLKTESYKFLAGENFSRFGDTETLIMRIKDNVGDPQRHADLSVEDVVALMSLCVTEEHIDLLDKLIAIVAHQPTGYMLYKWGHGLSRLYYSFNQVDRAFNNIKNQRDFGQILNKRNASKVILSLLYSNERYEQLIELFEDYLNSNEAECRQRVDLVALALAACNKMGTKEALDKALELLQIPEQKLLVSVFVGFLALKNNEPKITLDVLSCSRSSFTAKELRLKALIEKNRYEDALFILRSWTKDRYRMHKETYEFLTAKTESLQDETFRQLYSDLLLNLRGLNAVRTDDQTLEVSWEAEFNAAFYMFHIKTAEQRRMERQVKQLVTGENNSNMHNRDGDMNNRAESASSRDRNFNRQLGGKYDAEHIPERKSYNRQRRV